MDIGLESATVQQVSSDVVQPEALAPIVKLVCRLHVVSPLHAPNHIGTPALPVSNTP